MFKWILLLALSFPLLTQASPQECTAFEKAVSQGKPSERLEKFFEAQWTYLMKTYPEWATYVGYPGQNHRWTDRSLAAIAKGEQVTLCMAEALKKIKSSSLEGADQLHYSLTRSAQSEYANRRPAI